MSAREPRRTVDQRETLTLPDLIGSAEIARALSVARRTAQEMLRRFDFGPYVDMDAGRRIHRHQLDAFVARRTVQPPAIPDIEAILGYPVPPRRRRTVR